MNSQLMIWVYSRRFAMGVTVSRTAHGLSIRLTALERLQQDQMELQQRTSALQTQIANMASVVRLGRRFDSPMCQAYMTASHRRWWQRSMRPTRHSSGMQNVQQVYDLRFSDGHRNVRYVRNQKVASTLLSAGCIMTRQPHTRAWLLSWFRESPSNRPRPNCTERFVRYDSSDDNHPSQDQWPVDTDTVVFSFVREPVAHAVSAYLEVSERNARQVEAYPQHFRPDATPPYLVMPCDSRANATERFLSFLSSVEQQDALGDWFQHAWPQALKLNVAGRLSPRFDAIGRVENLSTQLLAIAGLSGNGKRPGLDSAAQAARATRGEHVRSRSEPCAGIDAGDPRILRKICRLYAADFECFEYPRPAACERQSGIQYQRAEAEAAYPSTETRS